MRLAKLTVCLLPIALLLWFIRGVGSDLGGAGGQRQGKAATEEEASEDTLARVSEGDSAVDGPDAQSTQASERREAVAARPAPGVDEDLTAVIPHPPGPVMGVVTLPNGLPVPGITVVLHQLQKTLGDGPMPALGNGLIEGPSGGPVGPGWNPGPLRLKEGTPMSFDIGDWMKARRRGQSETIVSGPRGEFTFEGSDRRAGGQLVYGVNLYLKDLPAAEVDITAIYQTLVLPDSAHQDSTWTVDVVDQQGEALDIDTVRLVCLHRGDAPYVRRPLPLERITQRGKVTQSGLSIGTWQIFVSAQHTIEASTTVEIETRATAAQSTITLPSKEGRVANEVGPSLNEDGTSWVDPAGGMQEWLPETILSIGENRMNNHFAQSLRVGHGPVKAAQLTLDLEANAHASGNDGLYLQHVGARRFAWSSNIAKIAGGSWTKGDRRTIRLDLSKLVNTKGETVNLLPHLEGGRLDIMTQDDTVVHDISLRIVR